MLDVGDDPDARRARRSASAAAGGRRSANSRSGHAPSAPAAAGGDRSASRRLRVRLFAPIVLARHAMPSSDVVGRLRRHALILPRGPSRGEWPRGVELRHGADRRRVRRAAHADLSAFRQARRPGLRDRQAVRRAEGTSLAATRPDLIVMFDTDHLNTFFLDALPIFAVGVDKTFTGAERRAARRAELRGAVGARSRRAYPRRPAIARGLRCRHDRRTSRSIIRSPCRCISSRRT